MISIHTTRVGGDIINFFPFVQFKIFQSTPPVWVVTLGIVKKWDYMDISIHTTRVGGDDKKDSISDDLDISIHTTRVGGDIVVLSPLILPMYFNPHHPCGW